MAGDGGVGRRGRSGVAALLAAGLVAATLSAGSVAAGSVAAGPPAAAGAGHVGLPTSIAALGDSITRGFNACGFYRDCTSRSWSTGDSAAVDSHRLRLGGLGADIAAQHNFARNGARVESLATQAAKAVAVKAQYVTVEIGANDACRGSEARMTPVEQFRGHVDAGLAGLAAGIPGVRVFVASIPDVHRLWETAHSSRLARWAWDRFDVCQSLLARPTSTRKADVARRDRVRDRVRAYNAQLEAACARLGDACRYDGGAVFDARFTMSQVSRWDYFHPNARGQQALAEVTWKAGFRW